MVEELSTEDWKPIRRRIQCRHDEKFTLGNEPFSVLNAVLSILAFETATSKMSVKKSGDHCHEIEIKSFAVPKK